MTCGHCQARSVHIKLLSDGSEICDNCADFPAVSGPKTDNILTRNSFRVRTEAIKYEGDTIVPTTYNRTTRKLDINPEFAKLYPSRVMDYFTADEIDKANMPKLSKKIQKDKQQAKEQKEKFINSLDHEGTTQSGMEKVGIGK